MKIFLLLLLMISSYQLSRAQTVGTFDGILNTNSYYEKVLYVPSFPNGTSNLAVDVILGNTSFLGNIELEVTGGYEYQNTIGKLTKLFAVGFNPGNTVFTNESRISEAMGSTPDNIAIGEMEWDSINTRYRIPISHLVATQNAYTVKARLFGHNGTAANVKTYLGISSQYTRSALSRNSVYYNAPVGIGTITPKGKLEISTFSTSQGLILNYGNAVGQISAIDLKANGITNGYIGMQMVDNANGDLWLGSSAGKSMTIYRNGNIGVGTDAPSEKLSVNGNIKTRKLFVTQTGWPDYVFDSSYELIPLAGVWQFIKKYKYLPGIPSAKEAEEKGISVGDNQALLLKKIEELTLYLIEQDKKIGQIERENQSLRKSIEDRFKK